MPRAAVALLVVAAALAGCGGTDGAQDSASPPAAAAAPGADRARAPIDAAGVREHLRALQRIAERSGGNRAAGTEGDRRTADYIAGRLRAAGWRVRFQEVRFPYFELRQPPRVGQLRRGRDFGVLQYSGSGDVTGRVRPFDTLGCRAAELGRLRRTDIVVLPRGTCTFRTKALAAQRAGAGAVVIVDRDAERPFRGSLGEPGGVRIPVLAASADAGARLARATGRVALRVDAVSERRTSRNVLAETRGAARRVAMAGGHLDSVPEGPGINDNASGVAALLEVAERLRDRPGLRLGFWAAEELGLYGSRHYVRTLEAAERRRIAAYVNVDMVGSRRAEPRVYDTDDRVERALRDARPGNEDETDVGGASDHAPFAAAGIPVGGLLTRGDRCYHRRCDTLENVDAATVASVARAAERALPRLRAR